MKRIALLVIAIIISVHSIAQRTVELRNLWAEPHVHVKFNDYTVSFTVKDINRALQLLAETGNSPFDTTSHLEPDKDYTIELYAGYNTQYHNPLQPILQKGVGAFLLLRGHAVIENPRHKEQKAITMDIAPLVEGEDFADVKFYDIHSGKLLFSAQLPADMYNMDLGIDY